MGGESRTLDQYLDAHHVTGLLIAKGDSILVERYQYGRTDKHRLTSFSMAKTIIGLLIGIAVQEGAIRSVDDAAETYVPGLKDTEYGRTPIRALLQMASGVAFREVYSDVHSDIYTLARLMFAPDSGGSLTAVKYFNTPHRAAGGEASPTPPPSCSCSGLCSPAPRAAPSRIMRAKSCGPRSAQKRTRAGSSTRPAKRLRSPISMPCCATGRGSA